jgi:glycosyltransferase involved in cell wall biosynthesis
MLDVIYPDRIKYSGGLRSTQTRNTDLLVSVVCVTYNAEETLPQLIKSVRHIKTADVEFVVVDGNSVDGTIDILRSNDDVIDFWISGPDKGIYDAMNNSLNHIKGNWVIFVGADDLLLDGFGSMLALLKDPNTIYYGNLLFHGKGFARVYDDYYLTKFNICQQAIFYPRAIFDEYKFDLKYRVYADYHFNLRCWNDPRFYFSHVPYVVSDFCDGGFSSYEKDPVFELERDMLFKKYLKRSSYYRYINRTRGFRAMLLRLVLNK